MRCVTGQLRKNHLHWHLFLIILKHIFLTVFKKQKCVLRQLKKTPWSLEYAPDDLKAPRMCSKAVEKDSWLLKDVPDHFKTQLMCDDAVRYYPYSLHHVPHWFVTQQQIDRWHDNNYVHNDEGLSKWYDGYKKRKAQKASIKKELLPITWHPSRYWDWCMSKDEKKRDGKIIGINIGFFVPRDRIQKIFDSKKN